MVDRIVYQVLLFSFFLNLLWEISHCFLYSTILNAKITKIIPLLLRVSLFDAVWITIFYSITSRLFKNPNPFTNKTQLATFIIFTLLYPIIVEPISLKLGRWEYAPSMPTILGIGITPLVQLAITGLLALSLTFQLFRRS